MDLSTVHGLSVASATQVPSTPASRIDFDVDRLGSEDLPARTSRDTKLIS